LLKLGNKRPLTEDDMYNPCPDEESEFLTEELERYFNMVNNFV